MSEIESRDALDRVELFGVARVIVLSCWASKLRAVADQRSPESVWMGGVDEWDGER